MLNSFASKALIIVLAANSFVAAKDESKKPGLTVGKKAPDFELKDQGGKSRKLSKMLKDSSRLIPIRRTAVTHVGSTFLRGVVGNRFS